MLLFIDVGNTRLKWAVESSEGQLERQGAASVADFLETFGVELSGLIVAEIWVSCVASDEVKALVQNACQTGLGVKPHFVTVEACAGGLQNAYRALSRLGVDRWVAAIGSEYGYCGHDRVVVDAGTAATIDLVTADGVFQGGVILPGAELMHDSLVGKTAGIRSRPQSVDSVIGKITEECVNSGAKFGFAGAVERIVKEMAKVVGRPSLPVVLCGGDARLLAEVLECDGAVRVDQNLLFKGLRRLSRDASLL